MYMYGLSCGTNIVVIVNRWLLVEVQLYITLGETVGFIIKGYR